MPWNTARIESFCTTGTGGTPSRSKLERYYEGGTIPWVKSGELRETIINDTEEHVTEAALQETNVKLVPSGALLLAMYGATVGRLGILGVPATTNQAVCHIIPDTKTADVRYLFLALSSQVATIVARGVGGAQPNISQGIVKDLAVPLPPLPEQRRIAEVLDRAEALRAKRRAALAQLDTLTQSIFLDLFGDTSADTNQTQAESLADHLLFVTSGGRGWSEYYAQTGSRFIRSLDVQMNHIGNEDIAYVAAPDNAEARRTRTQAGDVLLTITGSRIGRVAPLPVELEGSYVSQHVAILRPDRRRIDPLFLSFFLSFEAGGQRQIAKAQYGQTKPGLNFEQIRRFQVPVPPLALQHEFVRRVSAVDKLKSAHRASLAKLDALFASLQHRAFRGTL
jgi:type I restriction enzyme S subunit